MPFLSPSEKALLCVVYHWEFETYPDRDFPDGTASFPVAPVPIDLAERSLPQEIRQRLGKGDQCLLDEGLLQIERTIRLIPKYGKWVLPDGRKLSYDIEREPIMDPASGQPLVDCNGKTVYGESTWLLENGEKVLGIPNTNFETCPRCHEYLNEDDLDILDGAYRCPLCSRSIKPEERGHGCYRVTSEGYEVARQLKYGPEQFKVFAVASAVPTPSLEQTPTNRLTSIDTSTKKNGRGAPQVHDPLADERLVNDQRTSGLTEPRFENERGLDCGDVRKAKDRIKSRLSRA